MADEISLTDRQMQAELERQQQTAARLLDSLANRLGTLASQGARVAVGAQWAARMPGDSVRRAAAGVRKLSRRPAAILLAGVLTGFLAAMAYDRLRGRRRL